MATTSAVRITVTDEAAARIAELGMQRGLEQMLDKAREVVPYLRSIRVTLEYHPEGEMDPQVVIWCHREDTDWERDTSMPEFSQWKVTTFPPEVLLNFVMLTVYNDEADY
jgi:hypothetical protein